MKMSFIKYDKDKKNFKIPELLGWDVFYLHDLEETDNKIKELLQNENFKLYRADIRDRKALKEIFDENQIDIVMHLAAMAGVRPSIENPILYQEVNCM